MCAACRHDEHAHADRAFVACTVSVPAAFPRQAGHTVRCGCQGWAPDPFRQLAHGSLLGFLDRHPDLKPVAREVMEREAVKKAVAMLRAGRPPALVLDLLERAVMAEAAAESGEQP